MSAVTNPSQKSDTVGMRVCPLRFERAWIAASEAAPGDAAIKVELGKAEKDLKKNVYGW